MPFFRSRPIYVYALTILFVASCASKPKETGTDGTAAGAGAGAESTENQQPVLAEKEINFDPQGSDSGKIGGLNTVYFEYDQARLTKDAQRKLSENADWIKKNSNATIQIEGHTDERGSVEYNLSLGERRAKSVKTYLEGLGVDSKRLTIISYGEEKPVSTGDSESVWTKNRRANFVPLQ